MQYKLLGFFLFGINTSCYATVDLTDNLSLSGFLSTSLTSSDNKTPIMINRGIDDENCFDCDTTAGLQFDYFNNNFKASAQLVKRPQDDWGHPELEWAYVGYSVDNVELRAGRLRLPLFLASEYYYVGHAYTYARPPEELYNAILGITAYKGISAVWNVELFDEYQLSITPFVGFGDESEIGLSKTVGVDLDIDKMSGINFLLTGDYYRWNISYLNADFDQTIKLTNAIPNVPYLEIYSLGEKAELFTIGAEYEFDDLLIASEYQTYHIRDSWYVSAAYRINKFVPYAIYGENHAKITSTTAFDGKTGSSTSFGLRYDIEFNLSMNIELQKFHSFGGERGSFVQTPNERDADVYTLMLNYVF